MREESQKAIDTGSKEVLKLNAGDIKPAELGLEFAMRFAYRATDFDESNVESFVQRLAARDFSPAPRKKSPTSSCVIFRSSARAAPSS